MSETRVRIAFPSMGDWCFREDRTPGTPADILAAREVALDHLVPDDVGGLVEVMTQSTFYHFQIHLVRKLGIRLEPITQAEEQISIKHYLDSLSVAMGSRAN